MKRAALLIACCFTLLALPSHAGLFGYFGNQTIKILDGGDTAATEFFKEKTSGKLYAALPFTKAESVDLDHHVTNKALEGLFYMVGLEEKKIRTDPAAQVTDLLKAVFGKK